MMMFLGKGWIIDMLVCGCGQDHITTKKFKKNWEKSPQKYFFIFLSFRPMLFISRGDQIYILFSNDLVGEAGVEAAHQLSRVEAAAPLYRRCTSPRDSDISGRIGLHCLATTCTD